MKREFLQNLSVAGTPLTKEVIDAIMAENGRDIERHKGDSAQLDALLAEKETWEQSLRQAEEKHQEELRSLRFSGALDSAIHQAKGRNLTAIRALLDLEALKGGKEEDLSSAVEALREEVPYLFETKPFVPGYARGTGEVNPLREESPLTLAGALKERFFKERK